VTGEQIILHYAHKALLQRQADEREVLKRNHEEEREMFYRANKQGFDGLATARERGETL
jgi:hypothetical protein